MKERLLSICIPTYNRKGFLAENIDAILKQITPEFEELIEICVSDNASDDGTHELLEEYIAGNRNLEIRYTVNEKNLGPDRNFLLAMKLGRAKYIWLMGSDDVIVEDSFKKIIPLLKNNKEFGIVLFNRIDCTIALKPTEKKYWLNELVPTRIFDFSDKLQEAYYYAYAKNTGALFSFISSYIFTRDVLLKEPYDESYIGTAYSFLFYIWGYMKPAGKLLYLNEHHVYCRLGNNTLKKNNFATSLSRRLLLDYEVYIKIKNDFFDQDDVNAAGFLNILKKTHAFFRMFELYAFSSKDEWLKTRQKLKMVGWDDRELKGIEMVVNPPTKLMIKIRRFFKND